MTEPLAVLHAVVDGWSRTGTPVVPGVALGPVIRPNVEIPGGVLDAFAAVALPADEAWSRYDAAVDAVAEALVARSSNASGATSEVLVATATLVRDKGLRKAVRKRLDADEPLLGSLHAAV